MRALIPLLALLCLAHGSCEDGHVEPRELDGPCPADLAGAAALPGGTTRSAEDGAAFVVPAGAMLYASGAAVRVFVEEGGSVDLAGPDGRAWVADGASAIAWSSGTSVWFEEGAEVFGSNEQVVWMRCATVAPEADGG